MPIPSGEAIRSPQKPTVGHSIPDKYKYKPTAEPLVNHPFRGTYSLTGKLKPKDTSLQDKLNQQRMFNAV